MIDKKGPYTWCDLLNPWGRVGRERKAPGSFPRADLRGRRGPGASFQPEASHCPEQASSVSLVWIGPVLPETPADADSFVPESCGPPDALSQVWLSLLVPAQGNHGTGR